MSAPAHVRAQRALVRMLFDPAFAAAVRADATAALPEVPPSLARQLGALDARALGADPLLRLRVLRTLSEELKAATTLALAVRRSYAFLEGFFASAPFHRAVRERGVLVHAYVEFLAAAALPAPFADVLAIEAASARARREAKVEPVFEASNAGSILDQASAGQADQAAKADRRLRAAAGVIPLRVTQGALAALQQAERYRFEIGLMPALALCDDAPRLVLDARAHDATPLHLVTVPTASGITLVTIDADTWRVLDALPGVPAPADGALAASLLEDEIVVPA